MPQHLRHRLRIDPEPLRRLALAQPLDMAGVANPRIQFHWVDPHPPAAQTGREDIKATDFSAAPARHASGRFSEGFSLRRAHTPGHRRRMSARRKQDAVLRC